MKPATSILPLSAPPTGRAIPSRWVDYYELTKPRMNFLVVITTMVGFYMAARGHMDWLLLLHTMLGTALTAAAASVFNQYIEREPDARMARTADRPLPAKRIAPAEALLFGIALAAGGLAYLLVAVNLLTALLGALTLGSYVFIYTPMKQWSSLNTVVGAIPGAIPPMMGWTAFHGALSPEALVLFAILFLWQMPHFLAIAILYRDDYALGGFKMLPVIDPDLQLTGPMIVIYSLALIPASLMPAALHMAGAAYFTAAVLLGLAFLSFGISCAVSKSRIDARKLFFASIIYLPLLFAFMMLDRM